MWAISLNSTSSLLIPWRSLSPTCLRWWKIVWSPGEKGCLPFAHEITTVTLPACHVMAAANTLRRKQSNSTKVSVLTARFVGTALKRCIEMIFFLFFFFWKKNLCLAVEQQGGVSDGLFFMNWREDRRNHLTPLKAERKKNESMLVLVHNHD